MLEAARRRISQLTSRFFPLLQKGFWAVTAQALFAGSNFLLNILLARWLSPAEYGAFTVVYTTLLLVGQVHTALLTEPMLVFGSGRFESRFPTYLRALLWGHGSFALVGGTLVAVAAACLAYLGSAALASTFFGLALALPFLLFLWLARVVPYVQHQPRQAALVGGLYLGALLAAVFVIQRYAQLSAPTALLGMAAASLIAGLSITAQFDVRLFARMKKPFFKEIMREHWKYGRWAVATGVLTWVPSNTYYLLLPLWEGLEASGALKAIMNMVMPFLHANGAFATLLVPELVKARAEGRFWNLIAVTLAFFLTSAAAYWLFIGTFGAALTGWVYDGQYVEYAGLLWVLGALPLAACVVTVLSAALRAIESPQWIFRAYLLSTFITLTVGVACLAVWSLLGVALAMLLTNLATAAGLLFSWYKLYQTDAFEKTRRVERTEKTKDKNQDAEAGPVEEPSQAAR